jgi:hypothetical protein
MESPIIKKGSSPKKATKKVDAKVETKNKVEVSIPTNEYHESNHVMVDIETLATKTNAVIPQISAVRFCPITGETFDEFDIKISIQSCLDLGLIIQESTLKFWLRQEDDAREVVLNPKNKLVEFDIKSALTAFRMFLSNCGGGSNVKLWGNGPSFDASKLKYCYDAIKETTPWKYYNERCVRTIVAFNPEFKNTLEFTGIKHNGIDDCKHQVKYVSQTLNSIYGK